MADIEHPDFNPDKLPKDQLVIPDKPKSYEEKRQSFLSNPDNNEAWIYVWELKLLLDKLSLNDWVTPNAVNNLSIEREGEGYIGYVDLHQNVIYFNNGEVFDPFRVE